MTQKHIKKTLLKWIKTHPDSHSKKNKSAPIGDILDFLGDLIGWPEWYKEFVSSFLKKYDS